MARASTIVYLFIIAAIIAALGIWGSLTSGAVRPLVYAASALALLYAFYRVATRATGPSLP